MAEAARQFKSPLLEERDQFVKLVKLGQRRCRAFMPASHMEPGEELGRDCFEQREESGSPLPFLA